MTLKLPTNESIQTARHQRRLAPGLSIAPSAIHGRGCFATEGFIAKSQIAAYEGERIDWETAMRRRRIGLGHCICDLDDGTCIDGRIGGNGTEFINHSCTPNCELLVNQDSIVILALYDISPFQELTVNYLNSLELEVLPCCCPTCRTNHPTGKNGHDDPLR